MVGPASFLETNSGANVPVHRTCSPSSRSGLSKAAVEKRERVRVKSVIQFPRPCFPRRRGRLVGLALAGDFDCAKSACLLRGGVF